MSTDNVTVVFAADHGYARPLTTAARSIIATLRQERQLTLYIFDMGIDPDTRVLMERSLADPRVTMYWVDSLRERVAHLPNTWPAITRAGYARLYIPEVLPDSAMRALYLDCDVIARRCVGDLFMLEMQGYAAMAVPDFQSPFVSSPYAVPRWFEFGRSAAELNFNSGVMLIDVGAWRREGVMEAALAYLTDGRHGGGQDQEALNAVLGGRTGELDPRWNQQSELFLKHYEVTLPYTGEIIRELSENPWITHYSNRRKPWHYGYEHPFLEEWFAHLDHTAFAGWRPARK